MVTEHKGDLLKSNLDIICHQVNLQGIMGGGLAKQIATKYPDCEQIYKYCCKKYNMIGDIYFYCNSGKYIANCFSQNEDFTTNYEWLNECVKKVKQFAEKANCKKIGIPKNYGCGIANGDWSIVKQIWHNAFISCENIDLQIWEL